MKGLRQRGFDDEQIRADLRARGFKSARVSQLMAALNAAPAPPARDLQDAALPAAPGPAPGAASTAGPAPAANAAAAEPSPRARDQPEGQDDVEMVPGVHEQLEEAAATEASMKVVRESAEKEKATLQERHIDVRKVHNSNKWNVEH